MPGNVEHRTVSGVLAVFRSILRGKAERDRLRFADEMAARTQPPPNVPGGPYHRTSKIYYFTRDARREVQPPIEVNIHKQIGSGETTKPLEVGVAPGKFRSLAEPKMIEQH